MIVEPIPRAPTYKPLTPMQMVCACLLGDGMNYIEIATTLGVGRATVKSHIEDAAQRIPGDLPAAARVVAWVRGASTDVLLGKSLRFEMAQKAVRDRRETRKGHRPRL